MEKQPAQSGAYRKAVKYQQKYFAHLSEEGLPAVTPGLELGTEVVALVKATEVSIASFHGHTPSTTASLATVSQTAPYAPVLRISARQAPIASRLTAIKLNGPAPIRT